MTNKAIALFCAQLLAIQNLGAWGVRLLLAITPGNLPRISDSTHSATLVSALDWRVLAFTLGISFATGILFGLFPAVHVSRLDVNSSLKDTSSRAGTGRRQNRARGGRVGKRSWNRSLRVKLSRTQRRACGD